MRAVFIARMVGMAGLASSVLFSTSGAAAGWTFEWVAGSKPPVLLDASGRDARLNAPTSAVPDRFGNLYVADSGNRVVRKVSPDGTVRTLAGKVGEKGTADGRATEARFLTPWGIALDAAGNVFVSDWDAHTIRRISPDGRVVTVAGLAGSYGLTDGAGGSARFTAPAGLAFDGSGNLLVADYGNNAVRSMAPDGTVRTTVSKLTGSPLSVLPHPDGSLWVGQTGRYGVFLRISASGQQTVISRDTRDTEGLAVDPAGNVYAVEAAYSQIWRFSADGNKLGIFAGQGGWWDGTGQGAGFLRLRGIAFDGAGNLWIADGGNNAVRRATPAAEVTTFVGDATPWSYGCSVCSAEESRFPQVSAATGDGTGALLVGAGYEGTECTLKKVLPDGTVSLFAGGKNCGWDDGPGLGGGQLGQMQGLATDVSGNTWSADFRRTVRKVAPDGYISTVAGLANQYGSADGKGSAARFGDLTSIVAAPQGFLWVADNTNHTIRRVDFDGTVTTVAGKAGEKGAVDGPGSVARFSSPRQLAVDVAGNLWITDQGNALVRRMTPDGFVTTVAGKAGERAVVDGKGSEARFYSPYGVFVDASGNAHVVDSLYTSVPVGYSYTPVLRQVTPAGEVTTELSASSLGSLVAGLTPLAAVPPLGSVGFGTDRATGDILVTRLAAENTSVWRVKPAPEVRATIDAGSGPVGEARSLGASGGSSWRWEVTQRPPGSTASLSNAAIPSPTFTPDAEGLYVFSLVAAEGERRVVSRVSLAAGASAADALLLSSGRVAVTLTWRSPYDGKTGTGRSTPRGGQWGSFWFLSPENAEVFVKVLDFGPDQPYLLFWDGLTDFEYTVTFRNVATGGTYVANVPPKSMTGGVARLPRGGGGGVAVAGSAAAASTRLVPEAGTEVALAGDVSVSVTWRSAYDGRTGTGIPVSASGDAAAFWFDQAENPEIFAKALDWGPDRPYLLFWTSLTDFEYTVTFRNRKSGKTASFTKPPGPVAGGYDTGALPH